MNKLLALILLSPAFFFAQDFTVYHTGPNSDTISLPKGGVCLMGGATEDDYAMKWFLEQAAGGDILVLRASGSDGYNAYFYTDLGIDVHSVETIVFNNANAANDNYIHTKINEAEAIWLAGGNQWNYISYWRGNAIDSLINSAVNNRNVVIGGTSAGMAVQGKYYFSAENGSITSTTALNAPFDNTCTVDSLKFIENDYLSHVITDTHFDNPDRKGRLAVFLSRIKVNYNDSEVKAIACNEYTAVCIDSNGFSRVFGGAPVYEEHAYFISVNCEVPNNNPETLQLGSPLTWNQNGNALKVCKVPGTVGGTNSFDLNDWETNTGGEWYTWSVINGQFTETPSAAPNCLLTINQDNIEFEQLPKMITNQLVEINSTQFSTVVVTDLSGKILQQIFNQNEQFIVDLRSYSNGIYMLNYLK